ncbi:MAG: phenylacetate--CoA ligase family protein [Desulfobacteraceae bacterium]|uniref:Phenylacetate--CoA ligase family protein n=1 Tax=Candidatus Desulfacyla euxinica TaxID=2841693 RepID=A0A8J6T3Q4_9DELT|nr:phenylacetate--CoA ligase family protein [Candidatus Desulfacyla euxinica]MBL6978469.1 phenylacetate--CoA ligase family protein [Desulfobacteraceae bacterium]MBL7217277.1 phenylacetate--CoA ligase family protein [Desulfobacteraceae bacterium]
MEEVRYWQEEIETLARQELKALQLKRFRKRMAYVYKHSPMYKKKYDDAGIRPDDIRTIEDIRNVPFTMKEELRESQAEHPPWGDFMCVPPEEGVRVFQTTGTTGIPVKVLLNKKDWTVHFYDQFMHFMYGYGMNTSDILFVPFGYGLYIAWWGFQAALEQAGVMIVPGGAQSSQDRVKNILEWDATVVCGTPTYLLHLGETARSMGLSLPDSKVKIVAAAGEPGANVPATKAAIEELYGAKCYDDIGSSEISNFGFECIVQKGTHVIESMFYAECLDPDTLDPVGPGEVGELVLSNLCTESMPLLRYRMKDLVRFNRDKCDCGRTFLRLDGGILGRSDDMFQFAGVNIFPSGIENLIRQKAEFSSEYQIVVPRLGSGKRMKIRVEPASDQISETEMSQAVQEFIETFKYRITVTPDVEIAKVGELPRFELKAKRLIRE